MQQPDFMSEDYRLARLFNIVKDFVLASSEDGEGWIISPRYRELADKFIDKWFAEQWERDDCIYFAHEQEVIIFAGRQRYDYPSEVVEITVEIP